ncbi:YciI family protein [Arthrobacter parietis]|uniref:YciI family protein n=1 Tax=Arthrobacter parietis TaxID=271434 RepID=A0ABP5MRK1_9MICC
MKHLLLIPNNPDTWKTIDPAEIDAIMQAHTSLQQELLASGEFVEANELSEEAKFVTSNGGKYTVTDGPFIETKEFMAGYYIVDCVDMERAVEIAGQLGEAKRWPIEIRRINS